MAEILDFRHPDHSTIEQAVHAPPPQMELFVDDLRANDVRLYP